MYRYNDQLSALRSDLRSCKRKTALQQKQIAEQQKQIAEQQKQTLEYANRLDDYDKKNEESSRKFQTLLQVAYWTLEPSISIYISSAGIINDDKICYGLQFQSRYICVLKMAVMLILQVTYSILKVIWFFY